MNKYKKRNKVLTLIVLVLLLTIGFAVLSTTLKINGISTIGKNTWSIYWDNIEVTQGSVYPSTAAYIKDPAKTEIEYSVRFNKPGEFYEFTVDAVNNGTLDGIITEIDSKVNGVKIENANLPSYIKYSVKYADGTTVALNDLLKKKKNDLATRRKYRVRIEYDKDLVTNRDINNQEADLEYTFNYKVTYSQKVKDYNNPASDFADDSWSVIAQEGNRAAEQTSTDGSCGAYNIGDTKEVNMGTLGTHTVRIANCSTPAVCSTEGYSQTACGFVLEFADIISLHRVNPDFEPRCSVNGNGVKGGWKYSDIRAYLNSGIYTREITPAGTWNDEVEGETINYSKTGIYDKLPNTLKNKIASTTVVTGYSEGDWVIVDDPINITTSDKIYLLAAHEVWEDTDGDVENGISKNDTSYNLTRQLDYYSERFVSTSSTEYTSTPPWKDATKNYNGSGYYWWTRSISNHSLSLFYMVYNDGGHGCNNVDNEMGVSPAFKLKSS